MSVPPNYSVPPPRLNMPPPAVPPLPVPPPSVPSMSVPPPSGPPLSVPPPSGPPLSVPPPSGPLLSVPPPSGPLLSVSPPSGPTLSVPPPPVPQMSMPPPQLYQHPPPYSRPLPALDKPPPLAINNLPPLNVPPPSVTAFPPPAVPPPFPPPGTAAFHSPDFSNPPPTLKDKSINPNEAKSLKRDTPTTSKVSDREKAYYESKSHSSSRVRYDSPPRHRDKSHERDREGSYRRSSPGHSSYSRSRYSRSPSRHSHRDDRERDRYRESSRDRDRYRESSHRDRELEKERYYREKYERERMRHEYERRHSPSHHREKSYSSHGDKYRKSPSWHSHRSPSRHSGRSPSRHSHRSPSRHSHRSPGRYSHRSPIRHSVRSPSRHSHRSPNRHSLRSPSRDSYYRNVRDMSPRSRHESLPKKPLTDREKILEEYRKNYCQTSEDLIEKIEKWSKEKQEEEETPKMWYRSSPAELYYIPAEGGVKQTPKLEKICDAFFSRVVERGRKARPEVDELPPLKAPKAKMCKHRLDEKSSSSSSSESEESLDEDGLQGYTDRIMVELQRKQSHPRRLHPEMWFNNTGEMNGGPLCRCSARARRHGMRHGVYAGERCFPKCRPDHSNLDKLYHYRITVSPPTNFLIKAPTIIGHDEHEFLFSGFSMFSHYKLAKLPTCKVIRFNIEYTILYVEEPAPQNFTVRELDLFVKLQNMALRDIKVVEMLGIAPGPLCGTILADFGATVTVIQKIEPSPFDVLSNGKRILSVDLKSKEGIKVIRKLCASSDVLLDTFRPAVMEKLGLGPDLLLKENPSLIYARLTGYGQNGAYKSKAGHDINFVAMSGVLSVLARKGDLHPPAILLADFAGGSFMCALGILLALFERTKSGKGQIIDSSMTEGAAYLATWIYKSRRLPAFSGEPGTNALDGGLPFYGTYKTKDDKFMAVGAIEPQFYSNLLHVLQLSEKEYPQGANLEHCRKVFGEKFLTKTQEEWCQLFDSVDACVTPVVDIDSADKHELHVSRNFFSRDEENLLVPGPAPRLSVTPGVSTGHQNVPNPGQDTIQILKELGYDRNEIEDLMNTGVVYAPEKSKL